MTDANQEPQANGSALFTLADYRNKEQPAGDAKRSAAWSAYLQADLVTSGMGAATHLLESAIAAAGAQRSMAASFIAFELLQEMNASILSGEMQGAKRMLAAQAVALNAIFTERVSAAQVTDAQQFEDAMNVAFIAQRQCMESIKALATLSGKGGNSGGGSDGAQS